MTPSLSVIPVRLVDQPIDWPGWLSFFAAVIALGIAVAAYLQAIRANKQIAAERRTVFELEILRDLLFSIKGGGEVFDRTTPGLVNALPSSDLLLWRDLIEFRGTDDQPPGFTEGIEKILDAHGVRPDLAGERLAHGLAADINASIKRRTQ